MTKDKYPLLPESAEEIAVMASAVTFAIKTPAKDYYTEDQMHAYADAATAMQSERHAQEIAAYELTVSNLRTQVAGEPVAWRYQTQTGWHAVTSASAAHRVNQYHQIEPLYAAPQPVAQPERPVNCGTGHCSCIECVMQPELTDAEICDVAKRTETAEPGSDGYILPVSFARAVIAAHEAKRGAA
jgi:hypothetical protein